MSAHGGIAGGDIKSAVGPGAAAAAAAAFTADKSVASAASAAIEIASLLIHPV